MPRQGRVSVNIRKPNGLSFLFKKLIYLGEPVLNYLPVFARGSSTNWQKVGSFWTAVRIMLGGVIDIEGEGPIKRLIPGDKRVGTILSLLRQLPLACNTRASDLTGMN